MAGNGSAGFSGDGGPATSASLNQPDGIAVDQETATCSLPTPATSESEWSMRVGRSLPSRSNGTNGFSGDGGAATGASFSMNAPVSQESGVAVDASGHVLCRIDGNNDRIREIQAAAPSFTLSATNLSFNAAAGTSASAIATQQVAIVSTLPWGLSMSAAASTQSGGNWLTASPNSLSAPGMQSRSAWTLRRSRLGRIKENRHGDVGAVGGQQSVTVQLNVTAAPPAQLAVTPPSAYVPSRHRSHSVNVADVSNRQCGRRDP